MSVFLRVTVSGKLFHISHDTIMKYENSLLANIIRSPQNKSKNKHGVSYNRDLKLFTYILNFYETGIYNIPTDIVWNDFVEEIRFWGLPLPSTNNIFDLDNNKLIDILKWNVEEENSIIKIRKEQEKTNELIKNLSTLQNMVDDENEKNKIKNLIDNASTTIKSIIMNTKIAENDKKNSILHNINIYDEVINNNINLLINEKEILHTIMYILKKYKFYDQKTNHIYICLKNVYDEKNISFDDLTYNDQVLFNYLKNKITDKINVVPLEFIHEIGETEKYHISDGQYDCLKDELENYVKYSKLLTRSFRQYNGKITPLINVYRCHLLVLAMEFVEQPNEVAVVSVLTPIIPPHVEPNNEAVSEPVDELDNEPVTEPDNEPVTEPDNESVDESVSEPDNEPVDEILTNL